MKSATAQPNVRRKQEDCVRDLETLAALIAALALSGFVSATAGAILALVAAYRFVWVAFRAHRDLKPLGSQAYLSWSRGYWLCWCFIGACFALAMVRQMQEVALWGVGLGFTANAVVGLGARYTWDRYTRVTPETHPFWYWLHMGLSALLGPLLIVGATYRIGAPLEVSLGCAPCGC